MNHDERIDLDDQSNRILFPVSPESFGPQYIQVYVEIFKLYVEMADRISQRRHAANNFFLSINTAFVTVFSIISSRGDFDAYAWLFSIAGILLSLTWLRAIQGYADLNKGKFAVINEIERRLPLAPYEAEWRILMRGTKKSRYRPFSDIERLIPKCFAAIYILTLVIACDFEIYVGLPANFGVFR